MATALNDVCFRGNSGHWSAISEMSAFKADIVVLPSRKFKRDHVCAISGGEASKRDDRHGFAGSGKQRA
jgi:hypothetical protein